MTTVRRRVIVRQVWLAISAIAGTSCGDGGATSTSLATLPWQGAAAIAGHLPESCDTVTLGAVDDPCGAMPMPSAAAAADAGRIMEGIAVAAPSLPEAEVRRARALADLWYAASDTSALRRAILGLQAATALDPTSSASWSDLSGALLTRFARGRDALDLIAALDAARVALHQDPRSAGAAWNCAMALTWLGLRDGADAAWKVYHDLSRSPSPTLALQGDPLRMSSKAAAESGRWVEATRSYLWRELLPAWGAAVARQDTAAALNLRLAIDSIVLRSADTDVVDSPRAIRDRIFADTNTQRRLEIARGLVSLAEYRHHLETLDWARAESALGRARREAAFEAVFDRWTRYEHANLRLLSGHALEARAEFVRLAKAEQARAPVVARRAAWGTALSYGVLAQHAEGAERLAALAPQCERVSEEECVAASKSMLGALLVTLGDTKQAAAVLSSALVATSRMPLTLRRWTALDYLRTLSLGLGFRDAAADFARELGTVAEGLHRTDIALLTSRVEAEQLLASPDTSGAGAAVARMVSQWESATDSERDDFAPEVLWLRGELARQQHRRGSLAMLDTAVRQTEARGNRTRLLPMRLSRARAATQDGDTTFALLELDSLLSDYRRRAGNGGSVFERLQLAAVSREAAAESARLLLARREPLSALDALSGRRFAMPRATTTPLDRTLAVAVRQLGDSLLLWYAEAGVVRSMVSRLSVRQLESLVEARDSAALVRIYDGLIRPWLPKRANGIGLRIDARGVAASVPWSALRDGRTGRYLAEDAEPQLVDAAFITTPTQSVARGTTNAFLLIDAAPRAGDRALSGAVAEIDSLRQIWGTRARVIAQVSDMTSLQRSMQRAKYVHFAGHAILDPDAPERSGLSIRFARGDSLLRAAALSKWDLHGVELVVLAACDTRSALLSDLGGQESLAGVLHSIGVRHVIGASWPVPDRETAALMQSLHLHLRAGASPASALRSAQLEMLRSGDSARRAPDAWAAFQLLGS